MDMTNEFTFNARQYFDFSKNDDQLNDSYFDTNIEEETQVNPTECPLPYEDVVESENHELSDPETETFYTPINTEVSESMVYLRGRMRKSLSVGNLANMKPATKKELDDVMVGSNLKNGQATSSSVHSLNHGVTKAPSQDHINRLAQPKRFTSHENLHRPKSMTLAEALIKFQVGTPKRFRSNPSPKINRAVPVPLCTTKPHSPKLKTTARVRPVLAISKEEQEILEMEEAKKFKIKAHPVSKKVLKGPLKPQVEKKPSTVVEPFHLTETKKKSVITEEKKMPAFKAQPLPKCLQKPFKIQATAQPPTKAQTPNFSKRLNKSAPNTQVEKVENKRTTPQPFKPTRTQPQPFSFEKRDKDMMKKKEQFINKILEEEKKAREFHAKPPPKAILRSRNNSHDHLETGSVRSKCSMDDLDSTVFKARPATVLAMKPFEPKKDENHIVRIEAFRFSTDERLEARHKFDQKLKEKEAMAEAHKRELEEARKRMEEEEINKLRKQMEYKAHPIKKYKEVVIQPANKVTQPISPKFHTDKIRNKENIEQ